MPHCLTLILTVSFIEISLVKTTFLGLHPELKKRPHAILYKPSFHADFEVVARTYYINTILLNFEPQIYGSFYAIK